MRRKPQAVTMVICSGTTHIQKILQTERRVPISVSYTHLDVYKRQNNCCLEALMFEALDFHHICICQDRVINL